MKSKIAVSFVLICFFSCSINTSKTKDTSNISTDTTTVIRDTVNLRPFVGNKKANIFDIDSTITSIDSQIDEHKIEKKSILLSKFYKDSLILRLFYENSVPVKMIYTTFEDGGEAYGEGAFYFNDTGLCFANRIKYDDFDITELYFSNHQLIKYKKEKDNSIVPMDIPILAQVYREAIAQKTLADYFQFFKIKYDFFLPSDASKLFLKNLKEIELYSDYKFTEKAITVIPPNQKILFLYASNHQNTLRGETWIWYYVKFSSYKGWIFGSPELIVEYDDEN